MSSIDPELAEWLDVAERTAAMSLYAAQEVSTLVARLRADAQRAPRRPSSFASSRAARHEPPVSLVPERFSWNEPEESTVVHPGHARQVIAEAVTAGAKLVVEVDGLTYPIEAIRIYADASAGSQVVGIEVGKLVDESTWTSEAISVPDAALPAVEAVLDLWSNRCARPRG